ncbi:MAG: NfeD family protein [Candidatus Nanopelagicales bacterium]
MQTWIWIAGGGVLVALEMATTNLVLGSVGLAALGAGLVTWLGADPLWQALVFALLAIVTLGLLRPLALRNLRRRSPGLTTNVERLLRAEGYAVTEVTARVGQVKLKGEVWTARTRGADIAADTAIIVVAIEGATAIVEAKEQ